MQVYRATAAAVAAPNSNDREACCTINTPARRAQNGKVPIDFKLCSNYPSSFKLFLRTDLIKTSILEKTASRNSVWFRTYDFLKSDDLGLKRVHILLLLLLSFSNALGGVSSPDFKVPKNAPILTKIGTHILQGITQGCFCRIFKIPKIRFFTNFQTLTFLR